MKKIGMMIVVGLAIVATAFADGSISRVGAENGGSAAVSLSSTAASDIDLYNGLLFWIKDQNSIEGDKERKTTYPLSKVFDGSFSNPLAGTAMPVKGSIDFSLSFSFKIGELGCLNRLLKILAYRHFYIAEDNVFTISVLNSDSSLSKTIKTSLRIESSDTWYSVAIVQDGERHVRIYGGVKGQELDLVAEYNDTKMLGLDAVNVSLSGIVFGAADYPSAGNLQSGQFANIRFWTRALTDRECECVDTWQKPEIAVSDVQVFSGYPWKEVVIGYTITGKYRSDQSLRITAKDMETGKTYICAALDGAKTRPQSLEWKWLTEGRHITKWHPAVDGIKLKSSNVVFTVEVRGEPPLYCVIDLSAGKEATKYNVEYFVAAPSGGWTQSDGWTDEYKTTKLVLRRIDAGSFKMQGKYDVTLMKPFYMGVFEVTQKQCELVTGSYHWWTGDVRPVALQSANYDATVPKFFYYLNKGTGMNFNYPTEAQWEYACRAGTTTTYSYGNTANGAYMWYKKNSQGSVHDVGTRLPNPWGLYDMHGNVDERCRDLYGEICVGGIDPEGASSGSYHVVRGGDSLDEAPDSSSRCTDADASAYRFGSAFRLSLTIEN